MLGTMDKEKEKARGMVGVKAYLEVLGTHSEETLPSVMVTTGDTTKLLFNLGEGLVRSTTEHNVKATRATHLFVTHLSSDALSDFTSFFLRSHLTGTRTTHICGPPNLANYIFSNRYFFNRRHSIAVTECEGGERIARQADGPVVETIGVSLTAPPRDPLDDPVKLPPSSANDKDIGPTDARIHNIKGRENIRILREFLKNRGGLVDGYRHLDREMNDLKFPHPKGGELPTDFCGEITSNTQPNPSQLNIQSRHFRIELSSPRVLRQTAEDRAARFRTRSELFTEYTALSYLVRTPTIKGTFDAKKAAQLGVPKGPAFGTLQKGGSYTTPDGKEVLPSDVMSPSSPGPLIWVQIFAIISCPAFAFVDKLYKHKTWEDLRVNRETISVAVHYASRDIVDTREYKQFLTVFGDSCQHIFVGKGMCRQHPVYLASATQTCILNTMSSRWFPLPFLGDEVPPLPDNLPKKSVQGDHFLKFIGVPVEKMSVFKSDCLPKLDTTAACEEYAKIASTESATADPVASGFSEKELEIIFFGTGCSAASSMRNETAIYLNFFERGGMMMDVGNGTYGQMFRKYGPGKVSEILSNMKVVWVSHTHADHIQGVVRLLHARHMAIAEKGNTSIDEKVLIIGPHTLYEVLKEHLAATSCVCKHKKELHPEFKFDFVDSFDLHTPVPVLKDYFGIEEVFTVPVLHSFMSHAVSMKHANGWSLVFSGDTAYCQRLIDACSAPTVLIHEASFEDSLLAKAADKAHCTTSQAIDTGERMKAGCTLLTHFSQRYRNLTLETQLHNVAPAFDFMCVNLADYAFAKHFGAKFASLGKLSALTGGEEDEYVELE